MSVDDEWKKKLADLKLENQPSVVDPSTLYLGRSYSEYAADWFNWFLSSHADDRNAGPVVFLRSAPLPNRKTQIDDLEVSGKTTTAAATSDTSYSGPTLYVNEPNVRIGIDKLEIFKDQAVFVPIIVAHEESDLPYKDWGYLQEYCGITIDNGDNPPDLIQLTINGNTLQLPGGKQDFGDFRIATPIFTAVVPEAPYGASIKDFLEAGPLSPGSYPAMITGYFVLLKFEPGSYWVHSWASAGREEKGSYFSELLYQIDVVQRPKSVPNHNMITVRIPARFRGIVDRTVTKMKDNQELSKSELAFFNDLKQRSDELLKAKLKTLRQAAGGK
jgi:hypothetical protein